MKLTLPKIYPITDTKLSGLSHAEQVRRLIDGGATFIQLRDKSAPAGEFYNAAVDVIRIARDSGIRIIINDRVDIALAVGADGVHLGQDDLLPEEARRLLGPNAIIGFSTHSVEQARAAILLSVDYLAIGPIFPTSTKSDPDPTVGLDVLGRVRAIAGALPLVAIGGIRQDNGELVLAAGADSLAVIGEIVSFPDEITDRMRKLLDL